MNIYDTILDPIFKITHCRISIVSKFNSNICGHIPFISSNDLWIFNIKKRFDKYLIKIQIN